MVPDGWYKTTVGELIHSLNAGVSVNSTDQPSNGMQHGILKTSSVSEGTFRPKFNKLVDNPEEVIRLKQPVTYDTIVISRMNTPALVGANGYVSRDLPHLFLPDRLWAARCNPEKAHCKWLAYWFASGHTRYMLSSLATGTSGSMKNITKGDVKSLPVPTPSLPEQRKIAEILSTWDRAIEVTEKLLENATRQKRALMQQLLTGKRRFPEFEGSDWCEVKLGDIADILMGSSPKSEAYNSESLGLPLVQGNADIKNGRTIPRVFTSEITRTCDIGDFLLSVRAPVGTIAISDHDACVGRGMAVVRAKRDISAKWLLQFLYSAENLWRRFSQGSTFEAINSKDIRLISLRLPIEFAEQEAIGSVLEHADSQVTLQKRQLEKLKKEKKALMQQLLTGKKRVVI